MGDHNSWVFWRKMAPRVWHPYYGNTGCWIFKWGYKISKVLPKNQHTQSKLLNFKNWVLTSCWKLGIILVIKGFKNLFYQKMSIRKYMLLNWYSSMKKNCERFISIIENWLWKSNFGIFWYFLTPPKFLEFNNLFEYVDF